MEIILSVAAIWLGLYFYMVKRKERRLIIHYGRYSLILPPFGSAYILHALPAEKKTITKKESPKEEKKN